MAGAVDDPVAARRLKVTKGPRQQREQQSTVIPCEELEDMRTVAGSAGQTARSVPYCAPTPSISVISTVHLGSSGQARDIPPWCAAGSALDAQRPIYRVTGYKGLGPLADAVHVEAAVCLADEDGGVRRMCHVAKCE